MPSRFVFVNPIRSIIKQKLNVQILEIGVLKPIKNFRYLFSIFIVFSEPLCLS
jgi:hypothetical protein